jgi:hypothetical protein
MRELRRRALSARPSNPTNAPATLRERLIRNRIALIDARGLRQSIQLRAIAAPLPCDQVRADHPFEQCPDLAARTYDHVADDVNAQGRRIASKEHSVYSVRHCDTGFHTQSS